MTSTPADTNAPQDNGAARPPHRNAIVFIFITVLINMIGFGIVMPVMPDLIMTVIGGDVSTAAEWGGYLSVAYAAMQFVMMPIIGGLSDRFGRRPVLLTSLGAYSIDYLIMAVAPAISVIVVARLFAGAFAATFSTANAFIADISPPEKRAANFGLIGAAFGLGFIIGPGLGGIIGEAYGPRAPFFVVAALGILNLIYGFIVLPETLKPENRRAFSWRRANAFGSFVQFRQYPVMAPIAGALFLYQVGHWTFPSVWAYFAKEKFQWDPSAIGWSLMFVGLTAALVQGGLTRIAIPRFGERACALFGMCVAIAAYFSYAYATTAQMIYALIAVSSLTGLIVPSLQGIMSRTIPADAQGELQGAVAAVSSLAMIIGPPLMTQVFAAFSKPGEPVTVFGVTLSEAGAPFYFPGAPFFLAGLLTIAALVPFGVAMKHIRRPRAGARPASA